MNGEKRLDFPRKIIVVAYEWKNIHKSGKERKYDFWFMRKPGKVRKV